MEKPSLPDYPKWLTPFLLIYLFAVLSSKYLINIKIDNEFIQYLIFTPLVVGIFYADRRYRDDFKKYEISELRWKISNVEGWIRHHEKDLKDGQPWFDEQDPYEWDFDKKYSIRRSQETLEELKQKLEEKIQAL
jgi:hypothetical protein